VTNYTYNAANQMTNAGAATLTYDNNGNLLNDGTNEYTWDRANRLTFQNLVGVPTAGTSHQYDGNGNRVGQSTTTGTQTTITRYLLDMQPGLALVLSAEQTKVWLGQTTTDRYLHAARGIHAQQLHGGAWQHPLHDGLGSVRSVVDSTVATLNHVSYSAYGTPDAAVGSPFAFTGEQRDSSGLQYHRARYYSPSLGMWISEDPLETPNRYGYVGGNVVNRRDPSGLQPALCGSLGVACAAFVAAPVDGPFGDFALCAATVICYVAAGYTLAQIAAIIAEQTGAAIAEAERIVEEAFSQQQHPLDDPENEEEPIRPPEPPRYQDPEDRNCPTNDPPGSTARFDGRREMEDIICNIRRYTSLVGPQPATWWDMMSSRVTPIFGDYWSGGDAAFVGRGSAEFRDVTTGRFRRGTVGSIFIPRPGQYQHYSGQASLARRTRADIMAFVVHELRYAGQFYSLFGQETIRGQRLNCANITGRIAEVDALLQTNHWMLTSITSGLLSRSDFQASRFQLNGGNYWTEDSAWEEIGSNASYRRMYGNRFDAPPIYECPNAIISANIYGKSNCLDPLVLNHI
jgi:RHS repeat-associated protein